jgi:transposase
MDSEFSLKMSPRDFLSPQQVSALRREHKLIATRRHADRVKAILMLNKGRSFEEIADDLILDDDTVRNWYRIFVSEGLEGLKMDYYQGGYSKLDVSQLEELDAHVEKNVCLSCKSVRAWVKEKWGVEYSDSGMASLLHSLGFSYKKPSIMPGKPQTEEKQREFVGIIESIIANLDTLDQAYFMDAVHPALNPVAGYGWIRKGEEKEIPSNTGRERLGINGAMPVGEAEAVIVESEIVNAQSTIELCDKIQLRQMFGMIIIFADNARYYNCKAMQDYLAANPRVVIVHLPPYSPNLNLIERLWKFYKKKVLCQRYYVNLPKMREASFNFFENLQDYAEDLKTLMALNFQIVKPKFSETRS